MKCGCVTPTLFVGPDPQEDEDFEQLKALKITAILSLQTDEDQRPGAVEYEERRATRAGLSFRNVPVRDFDPGDLERQLPRCVTVLDEMLKAGDTVYVHCRAGVSRSPTVAAAYLHWCLEWPLERAVAHVEASRDCCPNVEVIRSARWAG